MLIFAKTSNTNYSKKKIIYVETEKNAIQIPIFEGKKKNQCSK